MDRNQQRTLETFGYAIMDLPNLKTIPHMDYITSDGKILHGLPADSYHLKRYLSRGLKPITGDRGQGSADPKTQIPVPITANSKPQGFVCETCGKEFKLPIALAGHKSTHNKILKRR